ncbi:MAG: addiction module protein, partial [Pseudomonadales bacterium]
MRSAEIENLKNAVLSLSEQERAAFALDLVASLDGPADKDLAAAWDIEICGRINELEKNPSILL